MLAPVGEFIESTILLGQGFNEIPDNFINGRAIKIIDKLISAYDTFKNGDELFETKRKLMEMKKKIEDEMDKQK